MREYRREKTTTTSFNPLEKKLSIRGPSLRDITEVREDREKTENNTRRDASSYKIGQSGQATSSGARPQNTHSAPPEAFDDAKSIVVTESHYGASVKTKYFVSNYYVEKIVDNMKHEQERNLTKIEGMLEQLKEQLKEIDVIKNTDLP